MSALTATTATFTKLRSGGWGVRVEGGVLPEGARVDVQRRDGSTKTVTLGRCVWASDDETLALYAIAGERSGSNGRNNGNGSGVTPKQEAAISRMLRALDRVDMFDSLGSDPADEAAEIRAQIARLRNSGRWTRKAASEIIDRLAGLLEDAM